MPPSLLEIIQRTALYFQKAGIETARLDAEWLMAGVLNCKRLDLFLQFDRPMEPDVLDRLRPLVRRRAQREPLQHILGTVDFAGLSLKVDRRALVPRPETEFLVELVAEKQLRPPERILDLGTGSGAIALALAGHWRSATVVAIDRSPEALNLARENARRSALSSVRFLEGSWFEGLEESPFDLIVSNPPYLTEEEWESAQPEVREYDPKPALVAAEDGIADLRQIITGAGAFLRPGGALFLETGIAQHPLLRSIAEGVGYTRIESLPDPSGRDRFFYGRRGG